MKDIKWLAIVGDAEGYAAAGAGSCNMPSCFCCGQVGNPAVAHLLYPAVFVCERCKNASRLTPQEVEQALRARAAGTSERAE